MTFVRINTADCGPCLRLCRRMAAIMILGVLAISITGCADKPMSADVISQNDIYTVTGDSVIQGDMVAVAVSPLEIQSSWQPAEKQQHGGWKIGEPNVGYPQYVSEHTLVDAVYNLSIGEIAKDKRRNGTYRGGAGEKDITLQNLSLSTYLALAYLDTEGAMKNLKAFVENERIKSTSGTYGSYPVYTDRMIWAMAAWEVYKISGDKSWLKYAYSVIRNSIEDDRIIIQNLNLGLMHGGQTHPNDNIQAYPEWMSPVDIYESMSFSNNILYAYTYSLLSDMADELEIETDYSSAYQDLKDALNQNFWQEDNGSYAAFLYGGPFTMKAPTIDNLGQSLSIIFDIADDGRAEKMMEHTPLTPYGIASLSPGIMRDSVLHNDIMIPAVQALWNIAASRIGNEDALRRGLGAMLRPVALLGTNPKDISVTTGNEVSSATEWLSSAAGNVAMIYRVIAGMEFTTDGIEFNPFVPVCFTGTKTITGFKYRNATIDITINGTGNEIAEIQIDGNKTDDNFFPATYEGDHTVNITMKEGRASSQKANLCAATVMPQTPVISRIAGTDSIISSISEGEKFMSVLNGKIGLRINGSRLSAPAVDAFSRMSVVTSDGHRYGFIAAPVDTIPDKSLWIISSEDLYIDDQAEETGEIDAIVEVPAAGLYYIDLHYGSRASGSASAKSSCDIRLLAVNTHLQGAIIMPRIADSDSIGSRYSNMLKVELLSGKNRIQVVDTEIGGTHLPVTATDYLRIIKK